MYVYMYEICKNTYIVFAIFIIFVSIFKGTDGTLIYLC